MRPSRTLVTTGSSVTASVAVGASRVTPSGSAAAQVTAGPASVTPSVARADKTRIAGHVVRRGDTRRLLRGLALAEARCITAGHDPSLVHDGRSDGLPEERACHPKSPFRR